MLGQLPECVNFLLGSCPSSPTRRKTGALNRLRPLLVPPQRVSVVVFLLSRLVALCPPLRAGGWVTPPLSVVLVLFVCEVRGRLSFVVLRLQPAQTVLRLRLAVAQKVQGLPLTVSVFCLLVSLFRNS